MSALTLQDVRLALRRLRKDAGSTIASVAALAFAIGAAVATWSLLSAVLLKPLPVAAPERLFQVDWTVPVFDRGSAPTHAFPVFESIRDSGVFDGVAAGGPSLSPVLVTEDGVVPQGRQLSSRARQRRGCHLRPRAARESASRARGHTRRSDARVARGLTRAPPLRRKSLT